MKPLPKELLYGELVLSHRDAVDELEGGPEPVEFRALVHRENAVDGDRARPDWVVQKGADAIEDHLEDGETAAEPFSGQEVSFPSDERLLGSPQLLDVCNDLEGGVLVFQFLLFGLQLFPFFHKRPREDVLERGGLQEIAHLLLRHGLLNEEAEDEGVAEFSEVVEQLRPGVRILDDVVELGLVVAQNSRGSVVVAGHLALLGHGLHEGLGELEDVALHQGLYDLEELFHDDCNALVAQKIGDSLEVRGAHEPRVLSVDGRVGNVEGFAAPQVVVGHLGRLVSVHRLTEHDPSSLDEAARGGVVTIVGEEVVVELPKDVERHPAVRGQDVVVRLSPHGVKVVDGQVFAKQLVSEAIHVQQAAQLHDARDVSGLEPGHGQLQSFEEGSVDSLRDEPIQVDGTA